MACGSGSETTQDTAAAPSATVASDEGHEHEAPHGGTLVELGEEFAHLELVVDTATGRLTAYSLDGEAEGSVALTQGSLALALVVAPATDTVRVTLAGVANTLSGETASSTSVFAADVPQLKGVTAFTGVLSRIETKGQQFENVPVQVPGDRH